MSNVKLVAFSSLDKTVQNLLKEAVEIRKRAYCPYSNFAVGAAILTEKDQRTYSGCNIENAAYSPCICAERSAVAKAVSAGYLKFKTVAIVADGNTYTGPCGVCRQTLDEFRDSDGDIMLYITKPIMENVLCVKLTHLLPLSFKLDSSSTNKFESEK